VHEEILGRADGFRHTAQHATGLREITDAGPGGGAGIVAAMSFLRSLRPFDVAAVLVALGALVASLVVWDYGKVDIGMTLAVDDHGLTDPPGVIVADVTPDGNAARHGFYPLSWVIDLTTGSGRAVERTEPIDAILEGPYPIAPSAPFEAEVQELRLYEGTFAPPARPVDSADIATATVGEIDPESGWIYVFNHIDRGALEGVLRDTIWVMALGLAIGVGIWRFLAHGLGGDVGRERAVLVGAGAATPFLLLPVVQVGTPIGIHAGYLLPISLSALLGLSLALAHPDRSWKRTGVVAVVVGVGMAALVVVRYMTSPALNLSDRGAILALAAAVAVVPAAALLSARRTTLRHRASHASLSLVPAAALTLFTQPMPEVTLPIGLMTVLLGWQLLPIERATQLAGAGLARTRSRALDADPAAQSLVVSRGVRDAAIGGLFAVIAVAGMVQASASYVMLGVALAVLVGFALRAGFLGPGWVDAAIPVGAAVGMPVMLATFAAWDYGGAMGWVATALGLSGLAVAHVLAARHSDSTWRLRLMVWAAVLAVAAVLFDTVMGGSGAAALVLACLVPLVPGLPVAFATDPDRAGAVSARLETLAVAVTPAVAATVLTGIGWLPLAGWLLAIVVWRQFTLAPLIGLAQRTQLQRDVAVAAAETERARLAADLHDDALQQLTMLVRTLDEGGHEEAAAEAREIATKLRSVVGDLRLPILDDLGAGAALEWLVERVEPLAGGPVRLDRSDDARPPANVELAVFRVAQEALTNAIKHGKPPIAVRYDVRTDGRVTLAIDDAGDGIASEAAEDAPQAGHFGLVNMQQRAEQIGALLDVRRWPSGGTRVALEWRPQ
jgi:signal transduction histidine kinase